MSKNVEDLLKQILLNMNYDSKKTLTENRILLSEECIPKDTSIMNKVVEGTPRSNKYPELGTWGDGKCVCDEEECLRYDKSCCKTPVKNTHVSINPIDEEISTYVTYQTVVPNQILTVPISPKLSGEGFEAVRWHNVDEPYDEKSLLGLFGNPCKILAGLNPKYPPGWDASKSYYINSKGDRCTSQGTQFWMVENTNNDDTYDYLQKSTYVKSTQVSPGTIPLSNAGEEQFNKKDISGLESLDTKYEVKFAQTPSFTQYFYKKKGAKEWILAKGDQEKTIKDKVDFTWASGYGLNGYDDDCKPLPYDVCMRWSWKALQSTGVDGGLASFKLSKPDGTKKLYQACIKVGGFYGDSKGIRFPWYSVYHNFYDQTQTYKVMVDGIEESKCKGTKEIQSLPEFKIGDNTVGSLTTTQINDLEKKKDEVVADYIQLQGEYTKDYVVRNLKSRLENEINLNKLGAIVMGK